MDCQEVKIPFFRANICFFLGMDFLCMDFLNVIYAFNFKSLLKNFSISHGSVSIANATRNNSLALKCEFVWVVKRVILVLLIPVFALTCDLLTDFWARNSPNSVSVLFDNLAKTISLNVKFTLWYFFEHKYFYLDTLCIYLVSLCVLF